MTQKWWRGAVIYQIYPRSFYDSTGNGIGDLPGITEKLDYIAALGVDGIWLSPFFTSPMKDYGYDVADYCDVDPLFGTLDDFRALLDKAHGLGLKIIIDQVMSHTSDQHPWFAESRLNRHNPKADWYVWADPRPDGNPPNNWQSIFGGPSWEFDMHRGQYYLRNFLKEQPDLNLGNPVVQDAILEASSFWLDMGVDGFRLDALNLGIHDPELRDNPVNPDPTPAFFNIDFPTPYTMQRHVYDMSHPDMYPFLRKIRALLDRYEGDRMSVAEIGGDECIATCAAYTKTDDLLHTAYNFTLLSGKTPSASYIRSAVEEIRSMSDTSWPSWALSNHDVVRVATRWGGAQRDNPDLTKMLIAMLTSIYGTTFLYQGDELGLPEAELEHKDLQDPWGLYLYPKWQGRDGCRTPMPWVGGAPHAGFSQADTTWLPVDPRHDLLAADRQEKDPSSALHFTRAFLGWRKSCPALITGNITFHDADDDKILLFTRDAPDQSVLCAYNMSENAKDVTIPQSIDGKIGAESLFESNLSGRYQDEILSLPPFGIAFLPLTS